MLALLAATSGISEKQDLYAKIRDLAPDAYDSLLAAETAGSHAFDVAMTYAGRIMSGTAHEKAFVDKGDTRPISGVAAWHREYV